MKRKTKSIGLCLLLVLALLFCSCQTSAVKEEQASADPTVTAHSAVRSYHIFRLDVINKIDTCTSVIVIIQI